MFGKSKSPESLPPNSDALKLHIERAHFQANVWKQANVVKPILPSPVTMGWSLDGDRLIPLLMTLDPIPQACLEMISCKCSSGCITLRCSCKKAKSPCTDQGRGAHAPPKVGKNKIFWRKIVIFHTKYPNTFRTSPARRNLFKCATPTP